ncbi:MAG: hypothetical protein H0V44_10210 [Planctomycetes bacterium]|nr:hypothetical protein [Planctomycetota bacterium]
MLTARHVGWWSRVYAIEVDGHEIMRVSRTWLGAMSLETSAGTYLITRSWFSGRATLALDGTVVAHAEPVSIWRGDVRISGEGLTITLRRTGWRHAGFSVIGDAGVIGSITKPGLFSSTWCIDLPMTVPVLLQCFAAAIAMAREADAAAAA